MPHAVFAKNYQCRTCGIKHPTMQASQEIFGVQSQEYQWLDRLAEPAD
jgi:hypothetical protein